MIYKGRKLNLFLKMLITFSGIDGSGKSTQIQLLSELLSRKGFIVKKFWARGGYTPGFEFIKKLIRLLSFSKLPPPGESRFRDSSFSNSLFVKIWLHLSIIDLIFYWCILYRIVRLFCDFVILDRYLDDTRLDFLRNFPSSKFEQFFVWKLLVKIIPKPDKSFLFLIPVTTSISRSKYKKEPYPDSQDTLKWRFNCYSDINFFPNSKYIRVDGLIDPSLIHNLLSSYIISNLSK